MGRVIGAVAAAQRPAEEVQAEGDRGRERDHEPGLGAGGLRGEGPAEAPELGHVPDVVHPTLGQGRPPGLVGILTQAEHLGTEGEAVGLGGRVVEAELTLEHGEVLGHARQGVGQAAGAGHRPTAQHLAEAALAHDVVEEALAGGAGIVEHVGFVVVGRGGQVGVPGGQVELGPVLLDRVVAEDAERHVLVTVFLDRAGGALAEGHQFLDDPFSLGEFGQVVALNLGQSLLQIVALEPQSGFLPDLCFELPDLLLHHEIVAVGL